jgi:hypothetical protein
VDVKLHVFLTYALYGSERSASRSGRLCKEPLVLLDKRLGGPRIQSGHGAKRNFLASVVDPINILFINASLTVQSLSSLHDFVYSLSLLDVTPCKAIAIDTYLLGLLFTLTMEAIRTFLQIVANFHETSRRHSSEVCKLLLLFTALRTSDPSFLNVEVIG